MSTVQSAWATSSTHLDKVCHAAVIVNAPHVKSRPASLPPQSADQAEDCWFSTEGDVVGPRITLNCENHESLPIKLVAQVERERRAETEERRNEVVVPEEPRVVVDLGGFVAVWVGLVIDGLVIDARSAAVCRLGRRLALR